MNDKELAQVLEKLQDEIYRAMENGASKEDILQHINYLKHEVENLEE
jgi:cytochrome c-type biogenesis protein CcmH/NrfF